VSRHHRDPSWSRRLLRAVVAGAALLLCVGGLASPSAWAHEGLDSSSPSSGEQLTALPRGVTLKFSGELRPAATVTVMGPDGAPMHTGATLVTVDTLTQPLVEGGGAAGLYTVEYTATSLDDHPVTGQLGFYVAAAEGADAQTVADSSSGTTGRAAAAESSSAGDVALWAGALVVALLLVALAMRLLHRRAPAEAAPARPVPPRAKARKGSPPSRRR
jgi:methionine-rich copper-binding protein CopC